MKHPLVNRRAAQRALSPCQLATALAVSSMLLAGCGSDDDNDSDNNEAGLTKAFNCTPDSTAGQRVVCIGSADNLTDSNVQDSLITALATAQSGDTLVLPQGRYQFDTTIEFNGLVDNTPVSHLTFRGAGMDKTIIDVSGASADGFLINNTDHLIFEDFGVYESNNNAVKVTKSNGVIMRRMAAVWETDYQSTNGAYGLYPVETSNVLIEDSYVKGSADAGIYVGQSDKIVVRNNVAEKNVAGIEIENSTTADVYGNRAVGNTGGILVFDLPIGNGKYGSGVRVFDNHVEANNAPNFANVGDFAGGVHIVPPGTGVIVLSTSDVEIYNNVIKDHQTTSIAISSYLLPDDQVASAPNTDVAGLDGNDATPAVNSYGDIHPYANALLDGWSPLVRNLHIRDNTISVAAGIDNPEGNLIADIIQGYQLFHGFYPGVADGQTTVPHILYDGIGELLSNTPNPGGNGETVFQAVTDGINQVAAALDANGLETAGRQIDLTAFAPYNGDGVCQQNNGIDGQTLFAASVFETTPGANTFDANGSPQAKIQQYGIAPAMADRIMNDPQGVLTCPDMPFKGVAATVTFGEQTFGCSSDDTDNPSCAL
jgi:parallel beta-helix repeat protein